MLKLNHDTVDYVENENLLELLKREGYDSTFVAIEVDGELVKRKDFETFIIKDNAKIEVFSIMGGG
ncbi:thiamine biosynthesis protein ThiS [Bifidobacteriaceae bacterium NR019]|uniref:sulfur carrier protein ThiS n=1 Tax=Gardnerella TaxID=2701 RepID=UPI0002635B03|nr:thiamine biosynthesis protein ThiS [Gardnerella vaginalis 6420B]RFT34610.1 thiamine biosynthesis protein ThiS [Bifidobacteriaceae bacterium NR019]RFT36356.1 thiamine biosynthesis protein ThiS [Bifidobacteriaceae bacterium NR017]